MHIYWILFSLGTFISLIGYIWLTVVGFQRSVVWGLLVLLFSPISAIIFAATNWYTAKKAFLVYAVSMVMVFGAVYGVYSKLAPLLEQTAQRVRNGELTKEEAKRQLTYAILNGQSSLPPAKTADTPESAQTSADADAGKSSVETGAVEISKTGKQTHKGAQSDGTKTAQKTTSVTASSTSLTSSSNQADSNAAPQGNGGAGSIPNLNKVQPDPLAQKVTAPEPRTESVSLDKMSEYIGHYFIITLKTGSQHRGLLRRVNKTNLVLERKLYGGKFEYPISKHDIKTISMLKHAPDQQ